MRFLFCQISLHILGHWVLLSCTLFWWKTTSILTSGWWVSRVYSGNNESSCAPASFSPLDLRGSSWSFFHACFRLRHSASPSPSVWIICSFGQVLEANLQFGCCNMFWLFRVWFGLTDTQELAKRRLLSPWRLGSRRRALVSVGHWPGCVSAENSSDASWGIP